MKTFSGATFAQIPRQGEGFAHLISMIRRTNLRAARAAPTAQGGHHVAEEVIRRRFAAGMRHFLEIYRQRVDYWMWFDNSGLEPVLVDEGKNT
ncbi:MAG TPA: hypothetical protein VE010_02045 [Thermoanaerobaculia bacterium]|nr:hypothetical protein [Thermoanaerobaculia bacterium]